MIATFESPLSSLAATRGSPATVSRAAVARLATSAGGSHPRTGAGSFLGVASSGPVSSGVPDLGVGSYALNLILVVAAIGGLAYLAARLGKGRLPLSLGLRARDLKVDDRLPIDPQRSIMVVSHGRRRFLVGMTQYAINTLAELEPGPDFEQSLQREVRG